jgi:hypothetical protein
LQIARGLGDLSPAHLAFVSSQSHPRVRNQT